jgi:hypothetical protein
MIYENSLKVLYAGITRAAQDVRSMTTFPRKRSQRL